MGEGADTRLAVVIEDDADVRHLLRTVLIRSGFEVILTSDGAEGVDAVREYEPIVTTLDVNMPGMDGFAAARRIREFSSTYLIMLTGLDDEIDIVQGLEAGADDYLIKPFRPRELRARIETILRRPRARVGAGADDGAAVPHSSVTPAPQPAVTQPAVTHQQAPPAHTAPPQASPAPVAQQQAPEVGHAQPAPEVAPEPAFPEAPTPSAPSRPASVSAAAGEAAPSTGDGSMHMSGLTLNAATRVVTTDGRNVDLTRTEFDLLASLMSTGRRVRSKADLVLTLRGQDYVTTYFVNDADKRAVEVHMANLRRKLGDSSATPRWIETVRGVGYRMAGDRA